MAARPANQVATGGIEYRASSVSSATTTHWFCVVVAHTASPLPLVGKGRPYPPIPGTRPGPVPQASAGGFRPRTEALVQWWSLMGR